MEDMLTQRLWNYIVDNNPDLMFNLQENYSVSKYLKEKVTAISPLVNDLITRGIPETEVEEMGMAELDRDLKPSKYLYVRKVLEQEFPDRALALRESGMMTYEVINVMEFSQEIFQTLGFGNDQIGEQRLYNAVAAKIRKYFNSAKQVV